jgi:hypothetical protein
MHVRRRLRDPALGLLHPGVRTKRVPVWCRAALRREEAPQGERWGERQPDEKTYGGHPLGGLRRARGGTGRRG